MTDVSQHVLVARIVAEYQNPAFRFADYFTIDWAFTPNALFYLLLVRLQKLVGPFWDARVCFDDLGCNDLALCLVPGQGA